MRNMHLTEGDYRKVVVRILGPLREVEERRVMEISVEPDMSLLDVLKRLPERLRERVLVNGDIAPDILVLVNNVELSCLGPPENIRVGIEDIREIVLIPVIHGG
ncbi:MAG: MoaD/ThiS family protein [Thaumarchaeota archaeon]|nr:MoaD/ThiS family protein [Nitrososphaerota archaeon]